MGEPPKEGSDVQTPSEQAAQQSPTQAWKDIGVLPRRPVLKRYRVEIMPTWNVTLNNPMVRTHGFGGQLNLYLSEALYIGLEGTYYQSQVLDRYYLVGLDQRVLPSINRYIFSAFLEFGYVPIHGKFTLFNKAVLHWEAYIAGGVGIFQSEIIPRDPANTSFKNILISGLLPAFGLRLSVNRWFALDTYIKSYLFADKLEPTARTTGDCVKGGDCPAKGNAVPAPFAANFVFGLGVTFFLPPKFEYKTPR